MLRSIIMGLATTVAMIGSVSSVHASDLIDTKISQYFHRVTGLTARASDISSLRNQCVDTRGNLDENKLFSLLFEDDGFFENRLASFASRMNNEESEPYEVVDDFQVSVMHAVIDNIDFRDLLTKPYQIEDVNQPGIPTTPTVGYYAIGSNAPDYGTLLSSTKLAFVAKSANTVNQGYYAEGLMTTQGFGKRSIMAGTNRRAVRASFNLFLCSKIESWKDASLDDFYVGRDVDRKPGDNPETYQNVCRGCHAPMDAMRGSMAHYDYDTSEALRSAEEVVKKYNQNTSVFPDGYQTLDAQWENLLTGPAAQSRFGWRGPTKGRGLLSFSSMLANSHQFQTCMTQRMATEICEFDETQLRAALARPEFKQLVENFRTSGYRMKTLIQNLVTSGLCQN